MSHEEQLPLCLIARFHSLIRLRPSYDEQLVEALDNFIELQNHSLNGKARLVLS